MTKNVITVVLPVYNVEKYLDRSVESVINQTYKNLEILLVDDGSTDSSSLLCDKWAEKDERIRVIHKKNEGLGMARNTGIKAATGEFIYFLDSDDYICQDILEKAFRVAKKEHAEIVTFGYNKVDKKGNIIYTCIPQVKKNCFIDSEVQEVFLPDLIGPNPRNGEKTNLWMSACSSLYSMELIRKANWEFVSERQIISEDYYSLLVLYKTVSKVYVLAKAPYFYCEDNTSSLTRSFRKDRYEKNKIFYNSCLQLICKSKYNKEVKNRISCLFIGNTIGTMKQIVLSDIPLKRAALKNIITDPLFQSVISEGAICCENIEKKILFFLLKRKKVLGCYLLILLQIKIGKQKH